MQRERPSVKRLTGKLLERGDELRIRFRRQLKTAAVEGIAHQWKTHMRHMHADLVGAARLQADSEKPMPPESLFHTIVGKRRSAPLGHCHLKAILWMTADRRIHRAAGDRATVHDGKIFSFDLACLKRPNQFRARSLSERDYQ